MIEDGVDIDALNEHCLRFVKARGRSHPLSMAMSKLGEFVYWLRADEARRQRDEVTSASSQPLPEPERVAAATPLSQESPS
jgi:hypothetical protein